MADTVTHDRLAVELAWQSGYDYALQQLADHIADLPEVLPPPTRTREEAIAERVELFEICAVRVRDQITREAASEPRRPWRCTW